MWGSDYPHDEGTCPFTREHLRQLLPRHRSRASCSSCSPGTRRELYDFDLDALAPLAAQVGPTVAEIAQPLEQLPDDANEALLRHAGKL